MRLETASVAVMLVVAGPVWLGMGGNLPVDSAVAISRHLGMTPTAIALTIVAIVATLPQRVTSALPVRKGEPDLAAGDVVGSGIFNILSVLGVASAVARFDAPARGPLPGDRPSVDRAADRRHLFRQVAGGARGGIPAAGHVRRPPDVGGVWMTGPLAHQSRWSAPVGPTPVDPDGTAAGGRLRAALNRTGRHPYHVG